MANETNSAFERRVSIAEKFIYPIAFAQNDPRDVFSVSTLIEKNVERQISDQTAYSRNPFNSDVRQTRVLFFISIPVCITKVMFPSVLLDALLWEIQEMPPANGQNLYTAVLR